jgi:DUF4097 and DUF4098 domain-containing protein YvlB
MRKSIVLLFTVIAAAGLLWADTEVNESRPADANAEISIENIAGSIVVTGWDRDSWDIEVDYPNNKDSGGADLLIRVPRGCTLEVETVSADIDVSEVGGDAELESVSGRINYVGGADVLELNTVSGAIEAITDRPVQDGDFESVSGRITLESDLASGGRFNLETVSGNIELRLPASVSADFDIESFSGSIRNDFGMEPSRPSRYLPSEELKFSLGGGDARVTAKTISGTIRLVEM